MTHIKIRRGTTAEWTTYNPVLDAGEPGFDTTAKVFKIGDGATAWSALPSQAGEPGSPGLGVPAGGATGQALIKASGADYATIWSDVATGGGGGGTITSVNGQAGPAVVLTKNDVALANVNNTSDLAKPISTATQTALNAKADNSAMTTALAAKAPLASPTFTGTVGGITKAMVGLGITDNVPDTLKPVSTPQQAALDLKQDIIPTYPTLTAAQVAVASGALVDQQVCVIVDPLS